MATAWTQTAAELTEQAGPDLPGLWALLWAARAAASALASLPGADDGLVPTTVFMDLNEAVAELHAHDPGLFGSGPAVEFDVPGRDDLDGCVTAIVALITGADRQVSALAAAPDVSGEQLACLNRVGHLLASARAYLIRRPLW